MAPVSDVEHDGDAGRSLSREDCLCPICLEIFMEPVTLPCTHTFCKACFLESVDKATLCCPLCRRRVAVWARQHSRTKSLVNEALWRRVQEAFPPQPHPEERCEPVLQHRLSEPGAVRQEYEEQVSKLAAERRAQQEQELRANEALIQTLLEEEEELLRKQQQQNQEDERLAHLLSTELNSGPDVARSREPAAEKKKLTGMDRFLFSVSRSPAHSTICNKENVLAPPEPPPLDYYGPHTDQSQPREPHTDQSQPQEPPAEETDQSQFTDGPAEGGTKRKSLSEGAESQGKRSCQSSSLLGVAMGEWEVELQRRRRQEEEDLQVALELQRELDRQHQNTDRRKGSADAYLLRAPRLTATGATATAPRRTATETTPTAPRRTATETTPTALRRTATETTPTAPRRTATETTPTAPRRTATETTPTAPRRTATETTPTAPRRTATETTPTAPRRTATETTPTAPRRTATGAPSAHKHPPTSTVTLLMLNTKSTPLSCPAPLTTPPAQKNTGARTKSAQDAPQTTRQTTLTDLFNLRR